MRKLGERRYREKTSIEDMMIGDLMERAGITLIADDRFGLNPFLECLRKTPACSHALRPGEGDASTCGSSNGGWPTHC